MKCLLANVEHDPEKWVPVCGKRSCSKKKLERDDDSKKSHHALGSLRAALVPAFALSLALADGAQARLPFWPQFGSWWGGHHAPRQGHRHRHAKPAVPTKDQAAETPHGPLQIIVSIPDQRVSGYDNDALIARSSVSTGIRRHPTPVRV